MGSNNYLSAKFLKNQAIFSQSSMQYEIFFSLKTNTKKKKPSLSIIPIPNAKINELAILFSKKKEKRKEKKK